MLEDTLQNAVATHMQSSKLCSLSGVQLNNGCALLSIITFKYIYGRVKAFY